MAQLVVPATRSYVKRWVIRRNRMKRKEPLYRPKKNYKDIVKRISLPNSPVGIDAQYTHAIVITYLRQITQRLEKLEKLIHERKSK